MLETVNWWHVIVAAIAAMVIGSVWYMPMVFGKAWMSDLGKKSDGMGMPGPAMIVMAIGSLVMAYVMAQFVIKLDLTTLKDGLMLGFWIWLGFNAAYLVGMTMFENRTWRLFLINSGNMLVTYLVVAAILASWK
jgi:hypothetical protein